MSHVSEKIVYLSAMAQTRTTSGTSGRARIMEEHKERQRIWCASQLQLQLQCHNQSWLGWAAREQNSVMWFKSPKEKRALLFRPLSLVCISPNKSSAGHILDKSELVHTSLNFATVSKTAWGLYMSLHWQHVLADNLTATSGSLAQHFKWTTMDALFPKSSTNFCGKDLSSYHTPACIDVQYMIIEQYRGFWGNRHCLDAICSKKQVIL